MQRWEQGLKWLGEDLHRWLSGNKNQHTSQSLEKGTQSDGNPIYQNIINNYSNGTQLPLRSGRFGFITIGKIVILTIVIGLTIKILLNPQFLVDSINLIKQFFQTI